MKKWSYNIIQFKLLRQCGTAEGLDMTYIYIVIGHFDGISIKIVNKNLFLWQI